MNTEQDYSISSELSLNLFLLLKRYKRKYVNGNVYIEQIGLDHAANLLGGRYSDLTKLGRQIFKVDCVDCIHSESDLKSWSYYLSL